MNDDRLRAVPLISLKKTHTTRESDLFSLREHLNRYTFLIHNNTNKYKSLLLFNSDLLDSIEFHEYDALIFATIKSKTSESYLTIVLLYKENNASPLNFTQYFQWIIARHNLSLVLGDFNEDFFKEGVVSKFLSRTKFCSNCIRANSHQRKPS